MNIIRHVPLPVLLRSVFLRVGSFGLLWWALTEGDTRGLWLAALFIAAATAASFVLVPPFVGRWRLRAFIRFAGFFLWQSVIGGIDVSRRALDPRLPIAPGFMTYELRFSHPPAVVLLADTVSLLPGTVGVELTGQRLTFHALDERMPVFAMIERLEERTADLFDITLPARNSLRPT